MTTWKDIKDGLCEVREHDRSGVYPAMGRSYYNINCPFCGVSTRGYVWSIGGGKRCPGCKAMHDSIGQTHKLRRTVSAPRPRTS